MNVLFVAYRVPYPPDKGERIRSYHQIRHLAGQGDIHLICPVRGQEEAAALGELANHCTSVEGVADSTWRSAAREVVAVATGQPRSRGTYHSRALGQAVRRRLASKPVDVILASTLYAAPAALPVGSVPCVVDLVDVVSDLWTALGARSAGPRSWLASLEGRRLRHYEGELAQRFDGTLFISEAEAGLFERRVGPVHSYVVGNGVDLEYFDPSGHGQPEDDTIVFVGSMDYEPNREAVLYFVEEVLPLVRSERPDTRFLIVGRNPTPDVQRLERDPAVVVTGSVPDVRPYLASAAVAVAPMRFGRGVQNKVLEALAMRLPVVATSNGLEGIDAAACAAVFQADGAQEFSRRVIRLLDSATRPGGLGPAAREFVAEQHRWSDHGGRLTEALEDVIARRAASGQ